MRLLLRRWARFLQWGGKIKVDLAARNPYPWIVRVLRWVGVTALVLLLTVVICALLLLWPPVQTRVVAWLSEKASAELGADVRIGRVALSITGQLVFDDLYVADLEGDTLLSASALRVKVLRIHPRARVIALGRLELRGGRFNLRTPAGGTKSNLTLLLDRLGPADTTSTGPDWTVTCRRYAIEELHFSYTNANTTPAPFGVDFDHVDVMDASIAGRNLVVIGDSVVTDLMRLRFRERAGLTVEELSGHASVSGRTLDLRNLRLRTDRTSVEGELTFLTDDWSDYAEFSERVRWKLQLDTARLDFADIALFAPDLEGLAYPIALSGRVRGTLADLKGRNLHVGFGAGSRFSGSAELSGLPDIDNTFMVLDIAEFRTEPADLAQVPIPPFTSGARLALPDEVRQLGTIGFRGNFTGFLRAFTAYGTTTTALGVLNTDLSYDRDTVTNIFAIRGRVVTPGFDLGPLTGTTTLGPLATDLRVKAQGRSFDALKADLTGTVPLLTVNGRAIQRIAVKGHLERNLFKGALTVDDEHLRMQFDGLADLRKRWPQVDFRAAVEHLDLSALGFVGTPGYNSLKLDVAATGRFSPDSLLGVLTMKDISYCSGSVDHELGDIELHSGREEGRNVLELVSDFAKARVEGRFQPTQLPSLLANTVYSVFPALGDEVNYVQAEQDFSFSVVTGNTDELLALAVPGLTIAPGATLSGRVSSLTFDIDVTARIPRMDYGELRLDSVELITEKTLDVLIFSASSTRQTYKDSTWYAGSVVRGVAYQDEVELSCGWDDSNNGTNGNLDLLGKVRGSRSIDLELQPSVLYFGRGNWVNPDVAGITIDSSTVEVDSLVLYNGRQRIVLNGVISHDGQRPFEFSLDDVELDNLSPFLDGPHLHGIIGGDGKLYDIYGTPYVSSYLCADSIYVQDRPVGDIRFRAGWSETSGMLELEGELTRGSLKALDFVGCLEPGPSKQLDLDLIFDRFDLRFIEPYLPDGISDIQGLVTGTVAVTGDLERPMVNGLVDLRDAGLRIDYLNTLYTFTHQVKIAPDMFALDLVTLRDEEGNTARIGGTILHDGLKDWNFNIWGQMKNLLVLNTTVNDNALYYGKAFATGDLEVSGSVDLLEVTMDASTAPGTIINFPIGGSTEVSDVGFVRFMDKDSAGVGEQVVDLTGIVLDLKTHITPSAQFELIFDPTIGDIMSGRGRGDIEMNVSKTGEFRMRGQVEVGEGDYLFTLRNVVNKRFEVVPGGRITWFGDPLDAQLDLQAQYRLRAPLYDVMFEKNEAYKKRVPVDVVMRLRDNLMNPDIGFDVRLPTVDENTRSQVNSVLSTEQERNRQVFALIVLNRFIQPQSLTGSGSPTGGGALSTTGSELISNQLSNFISKWSDDLDLGVNYRPGNNVTQDELEVAMSTQLFDERLLFSTNLGVSYGAQSTTTANTFIGDFQLEYLLTPEGRLRAKAFSVSNDRNLNRSDQAPTTQGAGIAYREEFSTLGELWQKILNNFRPASKVRRYE